MDRKQIEQLYTDKGFPYRPSPQDQNETDFFDRVEEQRRLRHRLEKVIRTKARGGKEYILYHQTLIYKDRMDNELHLSKVFGVHPEPQFRYELNPETRKSEAREVIGHKTVFDTPFSRQKLLDILNFKTPGDLEVEKKILEAESRGEIIEEGGVSGDDTEIQFILMPTINSQTRYGGFTAEEFLNKSFDELMYKAENGEYPAAPPPPKTQEQEESKQQSSSSSQPRPAKVQEHYNKDTGSPKRPIKEVKKGLIIEEQEQEEEEPRSEEESKYRELDTTLLLDEGGLGIDENSDRRTPENQTPEQQETSTQPSTTTTTTTTTKKKTVGKRRQQ